MNYVEYKPFKIHLFAALANAHMTEKELARKIGTTEKQIKEMEDGMREVSSREQLEAISKAVGIPYDFISIP